MFELVQRLIDLVVAWIGYLLPFIVLGDDQVGLVRRFGIYHRLLRPGLNWKIPIVEQAMSEIGALDSTVLREQSLTTRDAVQVTLRAVICYRVTDPQKYILGCATAVSVLNDVGCCAVAELVPTLTGTEVLQGEEFDRVLLRKVRLRAKRWGVEVESVGLVDRTAAPAFRLLVGGRMDPDSLSPGAPG